LQDIVEAASAEDVSNWPMLNAKDCELIGAYIVLFSYIEFNIRRVAE
jgi:hypothetical protein